MTSWLPGGAAACYFDSNFSLPLAHPFQTPLLMSAKETAHEESGLHKVTWSNIGADFSHTLLVLHATFRALMNSHPSYIHLQIGAGICAVRTADAVATGEVSCYYCIVRLRSNPGLRGYTIPALSCRVTSTILIIESRRTVCELFAVYTLRLFRERLCPNYMTATARDQHMHLRHIWMQMTWTL